MDPERLSGTMAAAVTRGHAICAEALGKQECAELAEALGRQEFIPLPVHPIPCITQHGEKVELQRADSNASLAWNLADQLAEAAAVLPPPHSEFRPNDLVVQRYQMGSAGVSAHHDSSKFRLLIVILTIKGSAELRLHHERLAAPHLTLAIGPGDLCVLEAPTTARRQAELPFHSVSGPTTASRMSLTFRMAVAGS